MASVQSTQPRPHVLQLPRILEGQPTLITKGFSAFKWVWDDSGSGANQSVSIYTPKLDGDFKDWKIVGHVAWPGYDPPVSMTAIIVEELNSSPDNPILKEAKVWTRVWKDKGSGGNHDGSIWYPEPPEGYRTLGFVATLGYDQPDIPYYRCVREDFCEETDFGKEIWCDKGSGADENVTIWQIEGSPFFYARRTHGDPAGTVYRLKDAFIPG